MFTALLRQPAVGSVALRGLTTLDGGHPIQGFSDIRDAIAQTAAITLGARCRRRPAPGRRGAPAAHRSAAAMITKDLYTYTIIILRHDKILRDYRQCEWRSAHPPLLRK
jgi:hypothetical protein